MTSYIEEEEAPRPSQFTGVEHALVTGGVWMHLQAFGVEIVPLLDNGDFTPDMLITLPELFPDAERIEVKIRVVWE